MSTRIVLQRAVLKQPRTSIPKFPQSRVYLEVSGVTEDILRRLEYVLDEVREGEGGNGPELNRKRSSGLEVYLAAHLGS